MWLAPSVASSASKSSSSSSSSSRRTHRAFVERIVARVSLVERRVDATHATTGQPWHVGAGALRRRQITLIRVSAAPSPWPAQRGQSPAAFCTRPARAARRRCRRSSWVCGRDASRVLAGARPRPGDLPVHRLGRPRATGLSRRPRRQRPASSRWCTASSWRSAARTSIAFASSISPDRRVVRDRGRARLPSIARRARGRRCIVPRLAWAFAAWVALSSAQYLVYGFWDTAQRESFLDWFVLVSIALQATRRKRAPSAYEATMRPRCVAAALVVRPVARQADVRALHGRAARRAPRRAEPRAARDAPPRSVPRRRRRSASRMPLVFVALARRSRRVAPDHVRRRPGDVPLHLAAAAVGDPLAPGLRRRWRARAA